MLNPNKCRATHAQPKQVSSNPCSTQTSVEQPTPTQTSVEQPVLNQSYSPCFPSLWPVLGIDAGRRVLFRAAGLRKLSSISSCSSSCGVKAQSDRQHWHHQRYIYIYIQYIHVVYTHLYHIVSTSYYIQHGSECCSIDSRNLKVVNVVIRHAEKLRRPLTQQPWSRQCRFSMTMTA